jgi:hypothetical protein
MKLHVPSNRVTDGCCMGSNNLLSSLATKVPQSAPCGTPAAIGHRAQGFLAEDLAGWVSHCRHRLYPSSWEIHSYQVEPTSAGRGLYAGRGLRVFMARTWVEPYLPGAIQPPRHNRICCWVIYKVIPAGRKQRWRVKQRESGVAASSYAVQHPSNSRLCEEGRWLATARALPVRAHGKFASLARLRSQPGVSAGVGLCGETRSCLP